MSDKELESQLKGRKFQSVIAMLANDEGVAGIIEDVEDGILILNNFANTVTYVVIEKITALRFSCSPTIPFTSTIVATGTVVPPANANLGFEELVNAQMETYRRLLIGTAAGDLAGTIGIVQNSSVKATNNVTLQTGYQSATITLTRGLTGLFGNFMLVSFAGLVSTTTIPNFTGIFHIIRGVGSYAGVIGGGKMVGNGIAPAGISGIINGLICPATVIG